MYVERQIGFSSKKKSGIESMKKNGVIKLESYLYIINY